MKNGQFLILIALACACLAVWAPSGNEIFIFVAVFLACWGLGTMRGD